MNIRLVMYLLGKLSIACAVAMVVPMITALLLGEYMFLGFYDLCIYWWCADR